MYKDSKRSAAAAEGGGGGAHVGETLTPVFFSVGVDLTTYGVVGSVSGHVTRQQA